MIRAYGIAGVRRAEARAMEDLPAGELMQRAARGLAEVVTARLEHRQSADSQESSRVVALVGAGDNGGDALYACAHLAADGCEVGIVQVADRVHEKARAAAEGEGATVLMPDDDGVLGWLTSAGVVLDGVTGIGGRPGLSSSVARLRDWLPDDAYVIAVDLPSGTDPAGEESGECLYADETVTFGMAKPVHLLPAGEPATGLLTVVDIGVEEPTRPVVERLTLSDLAQRWPVPGPFDDKYRRGVLGVLAGSERYPGAAVLTATAAVSSGVGMMRYVGPPTPTGLVQHAVPEAVMGAGRVQAHVIGPGIAADDRTSSGRAQQRAVLAALTEDVPAVVDAGALDLISGVRRAPTLLTPHIGELARLAKRLRIRGLPRAGGSNGTWEDVVRAHPVVVARAVADKLEATVLVKGAVTVVVPPTASGLPMRSQADGPPWLATAGSGDVLAGLAGTLLACGLSPLDAGSVAAAVHGLAGRRANPGGPVRALDVAHELGRTIAHLLTEVDLPADPQP